MAQLDPKYRRLDRVEARVHARDLVHVLLARTVVAQQSDLVGKVGAIGRDAARITHRAEVLAGIEAPADDIAMRADPSALVARAMRLRGILDDGQCRARAPARGSGRGRRAGRRGGRARSPACRAVIAASMPPGVDVEGRRVGLDRHRPRAHRRHRQPGRDEGMRRYDDLVACTDLERAQREHQSVEAVRDAHRMSRAAEVCPFGLERLDLGAKDVPATVEHAQHGRVDLVLQFEVASRRSRKGITMRPPRLKGNRRSSGSSRPRRRAATPAPCRPRPG